MFIVFYPSCDKQVMAHEWKVASCVCPSLHPTWTISEILVSMHCRRCVHDVTMWDESCFITWHNPMGRSHFTWSFWNLNIFIVDCQLVKEKKPMTFWYCKAVVKRIVSDASAFGVEMHLFLGSNEETFFLFPVFFRHNFLICLLRLTRKKLPCPHQFPVKDA